MALLAACIATTGCSDNVVAPARRPLPPPPPGAIRLLTLPTYDGSGQAVHPDLTMTPDSWGANRWHLVLTPYPQGNPTFENPSVYTGYSFLNWDVPAPEVNPIARPPSDGYLSDPDHLYNPETNEIWVYYRQVTHVNEIFLRRSVDGIRWSTPALVVTVPNHFAVSPTIVRRGRGDWWMWVVNGGTEGCSGPLATVEVRQSTDGIVWSAPKKVQLQGSDRLPWHIDVEWVATTGEFWAVYNGKQPGSCTTDMLFFAKSRDGVQWTTYPTPLLQKGAIPELADIVYRSSLEYDATTDEVTLLYSGAQYVNGNYRWHIATQQMTQPTLLAIVTRPFTPTTPLTQPMPLAHPSTRIVPPSAPVHELTNETAP